MSKSLTDVEVIEQSSPAYSGIVIFLHGSGSSGSELKPFLQRYGSSFRHLKIILPTAPLRPYTLMNQQLSHVWFDRVRLCPEAPECLESIDLMAMKLSRMVEKEVKSGIPKHRIIIGGFSMGGAMAMHLAYRYIPDIAGVFALSSFLSDGSIIYKHIKQNTPYSLPELFYCHGEDDMLVPIKDGQNTFKMLQNVGVNGEFHSLKNTQHELTLDEIQKLNKWITEKLPEN